MVIAEGRGACLARLRSRIHDGPKVSVRIARYILQSPSQAQGMSIATLASACGTSTASISRFCKDLEYASFKEFQLDLATAVAQSEPESASEADIEDGPKAVIRLVFERSRQSLADTERLLDTARLTQAARILRRCERVFIVGAGRSSLVAQAAAQKFLSLGLTAICTTDVAGVDFRSLSKHDSLLAISHTGRNAFVVQAIHKAAQAGAQTLAITNYPRSPVATGVQVALATAHVEHRVNGAASSSQIAQMCVVDLLYFLLASWLPAKAAQA
jgi:RpiR family transcriptional regulator, carbohydrate utilization regulator